MVGRSFAARLLDTVIRAAIAGVLTAGALLAILSFRSPQPLPPIEPGPSPTPTPGASGAPTPSPTPTTTPGASGGATPPPTATPPTTPPATPSPTVPPTGLRDGSFTGAPTDYSYGTMSVQIEIVNGKVVVAAVSQSGNWPIGYKNTKCTAESFNSRALTVSSGKELYALQFCSGATYSKWGYATSLQSALDQAKR